MKKIFLAVIMTAFGTIAYAGELEGMKAEGGVKFGETPASFGQTEVKGTVAAGGGQAASSAAKAAPAAKSPSIVSKAPPVPGPEKPTASYGKEDAKEDARLGPWFVAGGLVFLAISTGTGPVIFGAGIVALGVYSLARSGYFNLTNRKK